MYPPKDKEAEKAKISQCSAREIVDEIENLIQLRIDLNDKLGNPVNDRLLLEKIEVTKRQITDYLLVTDPRHGIFVNK